MSKVHIFEVKCVLPTGKGQYIELLREINRTKTSLDLGEDDNLEYFTWQESVK